MMNEILIQHAMKNVWCEPIQDHTHCFKPYRVSQKSGARNRVRIGFYVVNLPINDDPLLNKYHVYHIGQIAPSSLGLEMTRNHWYSIVDLMEENKALIDVYLTNGGIVPKNLCYLRVLNDYSVVLAVRIEDGIDFGRMIHPVPYSDEQMDLAYRVNSQDLYIRFYHNARFLSSEWADGAGDPIRPIRVYGSDIRSLNDYNNFILAVDSIRNYFDGVGGGVFYRDGFVENLPTGYQPRYNGSRLTYVHDDTIKRIEYHKLSQLNSFTSILDEGKSKYLVLSTLDYDTIDYQDDVDFYLISKSGGLFQGVFINRYVVDSVRQVTHNAWSINCDYVDYLVTEHALFADHSLVEVMVVIRQGGKSRGVPEQYNRIEDLYRLPRSYRLAAMVGVNATLPEWGAAELENSAYTKLMRVNHKQIDTELIADAYGYNLITKVAEPVLHSAYDQSGDHVVESSPLIRQVTPSGAGARAVFCYDDSRLLTHYYTSTSTDVYEILPPEAATAEIVEIFHAKLSALEDGVVYNQDVADADLTYWGFRCYLCGISGGIPTEEWVDVTGNVLYYQLDVSGTTPEIKWNWTLLNDSDLFPCVKINGRIHLFEPDMPATEAEYDGILDFTIGAYVDWFGSYHLRAQSLAPAVIEVFMDGYRLIRGLDYTMEWPRIIISKRPLGNVTETVVLIRTYGCPDPLTMQPYPAREIGFVKGGILSVDQRFDVRNDRAQQVNIAGRIYRHEEVAFAEGDNGLTVTDGLPYTLTDYITPVEPYLNRDTVEYRSNAYLLDNLASDYISRYIEGVVPDDITISFERYRIFSPFLNAIIHQMLNYSTFDDSVLDIRYGNIEVEDWIAPFKELLSFDLAHVGFDQQYVVVYPHQYYHTVDVSAIQYGFLEYLIRNYLFSRVELSQSVLIEV